MFLTAQPLQVFVNGLLSSDPPVISPDNLLSFISEVFGNIDDISSHHQRMLGALFSRQREQHPLVQSVTDIVLDSQFDLSISFLSGAKTYPTASLLFRPDYETYIKSYPLAEARHRSELTKNSAYREWLQQCYQDPRVRRRDLVTFISRPVTRLPRLCMLLEAILKLTDSDHPDKESLPLLISILNDFVKSTQPGIAAAEGKVKFWNLCESLVYVRGEIVVCRIYVARVPKALMSLGYGSIQRKQDPHLLGYVGATRQIRRRTCLGRPACGPPG